MMARKSKLLCKELNLPYSIQRLDPFHASRMDKSLYLVLNSNPSLGSEGIGGRVGSRITTQSQKSKKGGEGVSIANSFTFAWYWAIYRQYFESYKI